MSTQKVWFVTGASKGLGLALVRKLLQAGHKVAATSRTAAALTEAVGVDDAGHFLPLEVTLTDEQSVQSAIAETVNKFGRIDVVVNNAGYGQVGALEETTDAEVRANYDINVFAPLNVIRHAMPQLRAQGSGVVFNIASVGGFTGAFGGWGIYCSTKFAMAGYTESLAAEAKPFGIHAVVVYPGYFRTEFLSGGSLKVPANEMAAYETVRASQKMHQEEINGNQSNDPEKAAEVMLLVADAPNPPVHLFLGQDAYDMAGVKIAAVQSDLEQWKAQAVSTGYAAVVA